MNEKTYCLKVIESGRYVKFCDDHWYETVDYPLYNFTEPEARNVANKMRSHYVYDIEISDRDGNIIPCSKKPVAFPDYMEEF